MTTRLSEEILTPKSNEDEIFKNNVGLIYKVIREHFETEGNHTAFLRKNEDDLFQLGSIGLLKAIRSYDESLGTPWGPFAAMKIKYEIMKWTNPNDCPRNKRQCMNDETKSVSEMKYQGTESSCRDDYERLAMAIHQNDLSKISYTDDSFWRVKVSEFIDHLEEPEKYITKCLINGDSQAEIAKKMNVTRQRINFRMKTIRRKYELYVN